MVVELTIDARVEGLALGVVEAKGLRIAESSPDLRAYCDEVARRVIAAGLRGGEDRRNAVRQLLRRGGFKPAGRSKPAQEYLLRTVTHEGRLPGISNAVDLINAVSLDCALPISLIAGERTGPRLVIRYGEPGESYVFNRAEQYLDVSGLVCVCGVEETKFIPLGSPVKDSMLAKVTEADRHAIACIYAPQQAMNPDELRAWVHRLGDGFVRWCQAARYDIRLIPDAW